MIELLTESLTNLSQKHSTEILGDRSSYIGASELGLCPRKVVFTRTQPPTLDLTTLLRFKRGHLVEELVVEALAEHGKYSFEREVEVGIEEPPLKGHIDLLFTGKALGVLEIKSTSNIPDTPHSSWELQLHGQMGLLAHAYPDTNIKGAILAVDLNNGQIQLFNGYTPNEELFQGLLERATHLWKCLTEGIEPETEVSPLCGYCAFIQDCPRFQANEIPELAGTVLEFIEIKTKKQAIEVEYKRRSGELLEIVKKKGIFKAGQHRVGKIDRHSVQTDWVRLSEDLEEMDKNLEDYQKKNPYSVLDVKLLQK